MKDRYIIKVQASIMTSHSLQQVLIYNRDHKIFHQTEMNKNLRKLMGKELKKFFYARVINKQIVIDEEAPWQPW